MSPGLAVPRDSVWDCEDGWSWKEEILKGDSEKGGRRRHTGKRSFQVRLTWSSETDARSVSRIQQTAKRR